MKLIVKILFCLLLVDLGLLIFGYRILVHEHLVKVGESYFVEDYGDLGKAGQSQLACSYFTGRNFKTIVLWFSASNIMGRDSCPFVSGP